jgi:GT2 family glycosyltransferase
MPGLDLSVTICSWNTQSDLRSCLESLGEALQESNFEVIVVDNNSEDGSPNMVACEFPWVRLERMSTNLGFTGGHNHALAIRSGRHALLLNSDTVVHPGAIPTLMNYLADHPKVGILGPKLLNPDGSLQMSCRRFPNPIAALFRNTSDWSHDEAREVDWVSGAGFLVRDKVMAKIGFFDPEYFMYCEDVDWCFRTWEAGYTVMYLPSAVITHAIGRSTDKAPNRMIGRFHRSMFRFYRKNMVPKLPLPLRPFALAGAAVALSLRGGLFVTKNRWENYRRKRARH